MIIDSVFENGHPIPTKYTKDGKELSPPLTISHVPPHSKSLVLIVDDPDAPMGTFDHWIVWNISPNIQAISEGAPEFRHGAPNVQEGRNSYGTNNYRGPNPPPGNPHRYFFKLYALDTFLDLQSGSTKAQVQEALKGHILEEAQLIGTYQRIKS